MFDGMSLADLWAMAVGLLLPLLISTITKVEWRSRTKAIAAFCVVLIATAITQIVAGAFVPDEKSWRAWASSFLIVFLMTNVSYRALWKPTEIAPKIESSINSGISQETEEPALEEDYEFEDGEFEEAKEDETA